MERAIGMNREVLKQSLDALIQPQLIEVYGSKVGRIVPEVRRRPYLLIVNMGCPYRYLKHFSYLCRMTIGVHWMSSTGS